MFIPRMIMTWVLTGVLTTAFSLIGFIGNSEAAYFVSVPPKGTLQPFSNITLVPFPTNLPVLPDNFVVQEGQNSQMLAQNGEATKKAGKKKAAKKKASKKKTAKKKAGKKKAAKKKASKK
jgi:hypothetical protein